MIHIKHVSIDTVNDPCPKEFDKDPGMKKLTTTVERLFARHDLNVDESWPLFNYAGHQTCFTMKKDIANGKMFVCTFRIQKVKAFVSSCGTTRLTGEKTLKPSDGNPVTIKRPEVVDECERHKSSVDAASNLCDNLTSYHDIISTERCSFKVFSEEGASRGHSSFKNNLAFNMLEHC
ncbi:hypothetical protein CU097_008438 [Rhizopus azygosporus]|uniref:Uncharacterized protein n=1 Tax=Rhizopus azygosporus TaxID=86630 RepID=A0A367JBL2_RHIAZ|nr:hypothetical protein CU097_008438 [Rhizopus azygosporus]